MRNKIFLFQGVAILSFLFSSCNRIDVNDLKVINNLELGIPINNFDSLLSLQNISEEQFLTKGLITEDEIISNKINFYTSNNFDLSQYKNSSNYLEHLGLLNPVILSGTDNVISLRVLLCHTEKPIILFNSPNTITEDYKVIKQLINKDLINDIEKMYTSKYGKPTFEDTSSILLNFYTIKNGDILNYKAPSDWRGKRVTWKTKYFDIEFFEGFKINYAKFDNSSREYITSDDINTPINIITGETMCNSFPFITYTLNQETIKQLKLDKEKI